jgi:hemerythrin-like domain-containing protein
VDRRSFLSGSAVLVVGCSGAQHARGGEKEEEVTPAEDLMREHGVLRRVMYLYDEAAMRIEGGREVPLDALASGAGIIRRVIEDYHEKSEENFVFPRFEKAGKLADLTAVLRRQHEVGRALTDQIIALAKGPLDAKLATVLHSFNHMYRPHASREDTVLFPELRELIGAHAYEELGEQLEDQEKQILGDHGFERAVVDVAKLEAAFGVADLAKLTPSV